MIIAQRDTNIFLSDKVGIINTADKTVHRLNADVALKWGYWNEPTDSIKSALEIEKEELERNGPVSPLKGEGN